MKTTAIYARVSTLDKGQDITMQTSDLKAYAQARGWTDLKVYQDEGISGSKDKRPALDALLEDCRAGKIGTVIVWRFDRMGRSLRHLVDIADEFNRLKVEFISLKENIDTTTPAGKLFYHLTAAFAQYEREIIVERVRAGLNNARRNGVRLGKKPLPLDSEAIKRMKTEGLTVREIARALNCSTSPVLRALR